MSQRTPRFRVSLGLTLKSSCTQNEGSSQRVPSPGTPTEILRTGCCAQHDSWQQKNRFERSLQYPAGESLGLRRIEGDGHRP